MKIIAIEKEVAGKQAEDFEPFLEDEAKKVWELHQRNDIREVYFRGDQKAAVLILECESVEKAEETLSQLPLVREKLIYFEIIPLVPYPGFERLFRTET